MIRSAVISSDRLYRYRLDRHWTGDRHDRLLWVMLNPSTADGSVDDPTIRRCVSFSHAWGYGGLTVVNLYALRCTRPSHLEDHPDPVGPDNLAQIEACLIQGERDYGIVDAVLAWGAQPVPRNVDHDPAVDVYTLLVYQGVSLHCLGVTRDGSPRHPLYVRKDQTMVDYDLAVSRG